jgi:hypothetical protein
MEAFQGMSQWNRGDALRMEKEGSIMTVRAAEVAPWEEENRADLSRPVDERSLQNNLISIKGSDGGDRDVNGTNELIITLHCTYYYHEFLPRYCFTS